MPHAFLPIKPPKKLPRKFTSPFLTSSIVWCASFAFVSRTTTESHAPTSPYKRNANCRLRGLHKYGCAGRMFAEYRLYRKAFPASGLGRRRIVCNRGARNRIAHERLNFSKRSMRAAATGYRSLPSSRPSFPCHYSEQATIPSARLVLKFQGWR